VGGLEISQDGGSALQGMSGNSFCSLARIPLLMMVADAIEKTDERARYIFWPQSIQ